MRSFVCALITVYTSNAQSCVSSNDSSDGDFEFPVGTFRVCQPMLSSLRPMKLTHSF